MDTLVFDIETSNFFTSPGVGWNNFDALNISAIGVYSYASDSYHCFEEHEIEKAAEFFRKAGKVVGFSMNHYDIPVLTRYFSRLKDPAELNFMRKERFDIAEEIEATHGTRISLKKLAAANLGKTKELHSSAAIHLWNEGRIDELKEYCLQDVRLTKELYDFYRRNRYFMLPDRETGELKRAEMNAPGEFLFV